MGIVSGGLGRTLDRTDINLKALAAEIASTTGQWIELGDVGDMNIAVDVPEAPTGTTPTLLVEIEGADDEGLVAYTLGKIGSNGFTVGPLGTAPANITALGKYRAAIPAARFVRYKSTIGGTTPSFKYSVGGSGTQA